jgi:hypothetical protein
MTDEPLEFQSSDADPDDGGKWDQALKGEDYDLDADGDVDDDVAVDPEAPAPGTTPSPDQV